MSSGKSIIGSAACTFRTCYEQCGGFGLARTTKRGQFRKTRNVLTELWSGNVVCYSPSSAIGFVSQIATSAGKRRKSEKKKKIVLETGVKLRVLLF